MADNYGKGNIFYKLLIVILFAALVASIYYPKTLWEKEARNTEESRYRMTNLYNAELQFQSAHHAYTDSLDELIGFIKTDSSYKHRVDSMFTTDINKVLYDLDSLRQVQVDLDEYLPTVSPTDTLMLDSLKRRVDHIAYGVRRVRDRMQIIADRLKNHPCAPIGPLSSGREIVEGKDVFLQFETIKNMVARNNLNDALNASDKVKLLFDQIVGYLHETKNNLDQIFTRVDSLYYCPTTRKPYKLSVIDTSVIKRVVIESPIDSAYIAEANSDFLKSTIGALTIENHGNINNGDKSWEQSKSGKD